MYKGAQAFLADGAKALVVTKYGHVDPSLLETKAISQKVDLEIIESGHPLPDQNSLIAGDRLINFIESIPKSDSLVILVSGGASALAEHLPESMGLPELQHINQTLITRGYSIDQINNVRSRLSNIKGGKLLGRFAGRRVDVYAISDVPDDDIRVIGSGIGSNQPIRDRLIPMPESIQKYFTSDPTMKASNKIKSDFQYHSEIIASNKTARDAIATQAIERRASIVMNSDELSHDVESVAQTISQQLLNGPEGIYIWSGEPTVNLPAKPGTGGRNQHLALLVAREISGRDDITVIIAGSDGTDGPTQSAGGIVDGTTYTQAGAEALSNADSGTFLKQRGALFISGPTGTNVMDLAIGLKAKATMNGSTS